HALGGCGGRRAGGRSVRHTIRRATHGAGPVGLGRAVRDLGAGREEEQWVAAGAERERHLFLAREPLVAVLAAMLAGPDVEAEPLLVVDHHAVGAEVDPALVRVARDVEAAGAEIPP